MCLQSVFFFITTFITMATFLQWNIRGISSNYEELLLLTSNLNPLVISLQETLLSPNKDLHLSNYTVYTTNTCRGNALCVKNDVLHSPIPLRTNLEALALRITTTKCLTICSLYLSPSKTYSKQELTQLVNQLPTPFLIMGDLNAHSQRWGSDQCNLQGKVLEDIIDDFDLCILNNSLPTFLSHHGTLTHNDISICSPSLFLDVEWAVLDDLHGSDHFPTLVTFLEDTPHSDTFSKWKFKAANWSIFSQLCISEISQDILTAKDPALEFSTLVLQCAQNSIPKTKSSSKQNKTLWFDDECKKLHTQRKQSLRHFTKFPTTENKIAHQRLRAKTRHLFKQKRRQSWQKFCSKLNYKTSTKTVWKVVRNIKGKNRKATLQCLKQHGHIITDKKQIANLLASKIQENSSTTHYPPSFQKLKRNAESSPISFSTSVSEEYNVPFSMEELKDALLKSNNSAAGPDDIHYQFLTHLPHDSLKILLEIFNNIWTNGTFPSSWREATVIPIPKPGKDHSDPSNYRPIALTSCLCKTMERMVYVRLMWKLDNLDALSAYQCGFRKDRCTTDHLIRYESFIRNALVNKEHVISVLFDLEKAFDTTWKHGILKDLQNLGFSGCLPTFIKNFLSDRTFQVRLKSTLSDTFLQEEGVPQGSILSPLLFNLKINNIIKQVQPQMDKSLYVDDFSLSAKGKTLAGIERQLQLCINKIEKWASENGFKFSLTKTECIHFHRKQNQILQPCLNLYGQHIKVVNQVKFLGLIFDTKLSFLPHLKYLKTNCQNSLNILKVISHTDWGADKQTLLMLYRSLVRSKLDYGSIIYGSTRKSYLKMLDPIHHQGLRICLGAFRTSPKDSLYAEAGEPPLELRRLRLSLNYYLKLKSMPENPAYSCVLDPQFQDKFEKKPTEIPPFGLRMKSHLKSANINTDIISDYPLQTTTPPWKLQTPQVDFSLSHFSKSNTPNEKFKQLYLERNEQYLEYEHIFTDGSLKDGAVAAAAVSQRDYKKPFQLRLPDGGSIYTAELQAILLALKHCLQSTHSKFLLLSDSLSALQTIHSRKITHPLLADIQELHSKLVLDGKTLVFIWVPSHVGIIGNETVDAAAKAALSHEIPTCPPPYIFYRDQYSKTHTYCNFLWQESWSSQTENKLFKFMPKLSDPLPSVSSPRKEQTVLSRLHIGHTYITHSFILKQEEPPWCFACDHPLTIYHLLTDCSDLIQQRENFLNFSTQNMFSHPHAVLNYFKAINLFHRL